jgi:copper chaperone NosL
MPKVLKNSLWLFLFLAACGSGTVKPVDIEANDMCSFCKMAISEKQFAAEIIDQDDNALKFDDIGCMLRYRQAQGDKLKPAAVFVADVETRQWVSADKAFYVRSTTMKTPMASGIVAYSSSAKAGPSAVRFDQISTIQK